MQKKILIKKAKDNSKENSNIYIWNKNNAKLIKCTITQKLQKSVLSIFIKNVVTI